MKPVYNRMDNAGRQGVRQYWIDSLVEREPSDSLYELIQEGVKRSSNPTS